MFHDESSTFTDTVLLEHAAWVLGHVQKMQNEHQWCFMWVCLTSSTNGTVLVAGLVTEQCRHMQVRGTLWGCRWILLTVCGEQ